MSLAICKALFAALGITGGFWLSDMPTWEPRFRSTTYKQAKRRKRRLGFRK